MIENLSPWVSILFGMTVFATLLFFYQANAKAKRLTGAIFLWSIAQASLAYTGFFLHTTSQPPRFALVLLPTTFLIICGLFPKPLAWVMKRRNLQLSTLLHVVRVPVELVLWQLYLHQAVPQLMTFEGRNFDILIGFSAPLIAFLWWKKILSARLLLIWNVIGLIFVSWILVHGILSAELPFQQFAFDQPNRGIAYFPFVLLPATIVPIVIYTHLTDLLKLRQMLRERN